MPSSATNTLRRVSDSYTYDFRRRRAINWLVIASAIVLPWLATHTFTVSVRAFLAGRYVDSALKILTSSGLAAAGVFALIGGFIADKFGGRKTLFVSTLGVAVSALVFGLLGYAFPAGPKGQLIFGFLIATWSAFCAFEALGLVAAIKVNVAWFHHTERGLFAGIFAGLVLVGQWVCYVIASSLRTTMSWQWLYFVTAITVTIIASFVYRVVRDTPEECGLEAPDSPTVTKKQKIKNATFIAIAQLCAGGISYGIFTWLTPYLLEARKIPIDSALLGENPLSLVLAMLGGGMATGAISDWMFKSRRAPLALLGLLVQLAGSAVIWLSHDLGWIVIAVVLIVIAGAGISVMLATAAAMDLGGKSTSGKLAGLFIAMPYAGSALLALLMKRALSQSGWQDFLPMLMVMAIIGTIAMGVLTFTKTRSQA